MNVQVSKYWRRAVDLEVSKARPDVIPDDFAARFPCIMALDMIKLEQRIRPCAILALLNLPRLAEITNARIEFLDEALSANNPVALVRPCHFPW